MIFPETCRKLYKILGLKAISLVDLHISWILLWKSNKLLDVHSRIYVNQLDLWPLNQESYNVRPPFDI